MVLLIRDWLKAEPGMSIEEIQHKFREIGTHLSLATTRNYRESARLFLNREVLFGPDAERLFRTPKRR
jgi:hypothetical protein